jgi:hypothetical protein
MQAGGRGGELLIVLRARESAGARKEEREKGEGEEASE